MTKAQHTPGPWELDQNGNIRMVGEVNGIERSYVFVKAYHAHGAFNSATQEANARLVASAPELLAALKLLSAHTAIWNNPCTGRDAEVHQIVSAAIAKATGQAA